jgi:hypothetical protein
LQQQPAKFVQTPSSFSQVIVDRCIFPSLATGWFTMCAWSSYHRRNPSCRTRRPAIRSSNPQVVVVAAVACFLRLEWTIGRIGTRKPNDSSRSNQPSTSFGQNWSGNGTLTGMSSPLIKRALPVTDLLRYQYTGRDPYGSEGEQRPDWRRRCLRLLLPLSSSPLLQLCTRKNIYGLGVGRDSRNEL